MARGATIVLAAVILGAAAPATASDPVKRVVLINPTPELAHAARTALAPWKIDVLEFRTELIKPEEVPAIAGPARALVAARFGGVRLIDTLLLHTA